jgi:hypothetical protein
MQKVPAVFCLLLFFSVSAHAAAPAADILSKESLREFYTETDKVADQFIDSHDTSGISDFFQQRLTEDFSYKEHAVLVAGANSPQEKDTTADRAKFIEMQIQGLEMVSKIESHQRNITDIIFSDNKKIAQVSITETTVANVRLPDGRGGTVPAQMSAQGTCDDVMSLHEGIVQVNSSECNNHVQVTLQQESAGNVYVR